MNKTKYISLIKTIPQWQNKTSTELGRILQLPLEAIGATLKLMKHKPKEGPLGNIELVFKDGELVRQPIKQ